MKKDLWLVLVFLLAFLLGACAMNISAADMESTAPTIAEATPPAAPETVPTETEAELTEQEKAIAQCRAVLDAVQSGTNYKITLTRWYEGVWDPTTQITYYRSGDHRAVRSKSSTDDHDGEYLNWMGTSIKVCINNKTYSGYATTGEAMAWEGPLTDETLTFDPWMYTFDWDAQPVQLQEIRKTEEGHCVTFQVEGTYPGDRVMSEYYTITFYFDEDGNFIERELVATGVEQSFTIENGMAVPTGKPADSNIVLTRVDHVTIESLDPDTCATEIDAFYQEALAYQNMHG